MFESPEDAEQAAARLSEELRAAGWKRVPLIPNSE